MRARGYFVPVQFGLAIVSVSLVCADPEPNVPVFGSAMSSLQFLDVAHSTVWPKESLGQEGALDGLRMKDGKTKRLVVITRDDDMPNEIWVEGSSKPCINIHTPSFVI